jgi:RHS repeat-associated protein
MNTFSLCAPPHKTAWDFRNRLAKSKDQRYTVHYRYGADGERAVKYGSNGNQTLYFNGMVEVSRHHNLEWVESKHIYAGDTRIATKRRHEGNDNYGEEERSIYYYHGDHLGSAQLVTDYRGEVYEHLEYTPYGELWVEEVRAGEEKTPFRFTGKRLDEETGLYYYGARYLDPQTSRWLSTDPAMGEYIPQAPVNEEARKRNGNLPGMGGVFNTVNLHVYHYAGNNPVKYIDPDGRLIHLDDPVTEDAALKDITLAAGQGFYFDENNNLQIDHNVTPTGKYSKEMRESLISLIEGEYKDISVSLLYSVEYEIHERGLKGEIQTGTPQNLGFTNYGDPDQTTFRVGVPFGLYENNNGESAAILIHEWLGHLMPTLRGEKNVNGRQRTMPIINDLGFFTPSFLKGSWAPGIGHDGELYPKNQGWAQPR